MNSIGGRPRSVHTVGREWRDNMSDLINKQDAIEAIENVSCFDGKGISALKCEAIDDAVRTIRKLPTAQPEDEFDCCELTPDGGIDANYAIDVLKNIPSAQQWIPCSERLPSEDGRYLVSYWLMKDMPWISVMYYGKPTFPETDHPCFYVSDDEYGDVEYNDIVAWMPLPEPYKGVTE